MKNIYIDYIVQIKFSSSGSRLYVCSGEKNDKWVWVIGGKEKVRNMINRMYEGGVECMEF